MGQRNMVCTSQMLDTEVDEQGQGHLNPEPHFLLENIAHFPHPNIYPILLAPVNTTDHDICQLPDHHPNSIYYGVQFNGLLHHHPISANDLGASSTYANHYMVPSSGSRTCPLPLNHVSSDQLLASSSNGAIGVGSNGYEGNGHFTNGVRTSYKSKNVEGVSRNYHHFNGCASSSSSSLGMPPSTGFFQSEGHCEPGAGMLGNLGFLPPDYRANGVFPITEGGYRSRSNALGFHPGSTLPNQNNLVPGCYMGQPFQPASSAWVEQRFDNSGSDVGTSTWNNGPVIPYLHGRSVNVGPPEVMSIGVQGYSDAMNSISTILSHPTMHHPFHYPTPVQGMHGHEYSYHPQASMASYRHPLNNALHQDMLNPSVDNTETRARFSRPFTSNDIRTSRSHHGGSRHSNRPFLRILPEDEVGILEIPGFYEVGNDPHQDMRLDIDDMSYEELLALGGRIGNVKAGLSEESISSRLKTKIYCSSTAGEMNQETCIVCQDEYENQEKIGTLDCGHEYHAGCIKQWLQVKNMCPICKTAAFT